MENGWRSVTSPVESVSVAVRDADATDREHGRKSAGWEPRAFLALRGVSPSGRTVRQAIAIPDRAPFVGMTDVEMVDTAAAEIKNFAARVSAPAWAA